MSEMTFRRSQKVERDSFFRCPVTLIEIGQFSLYGDCSVPMIQIEQH
jgi:hypothetical protein